MDIKGFIDEALKLGSQSGLSALNPIQRKVFLISEAEVSCDMDGIDSLIDRYGASMLLEAAEAFSAVGASAIAAGLEEVAHSSPSTNKELLDRVNTLIRNRSGYDADSIEGYMAGHT
jgi:hypothetical protein